MSSARTLTEAVAQTRPDTPEFTPPTWLIMATLSLCGTAVALQQTLVVPLLPELPTLLDTSADNASWLVTATLLAGTVATPVVTRLADMFGKRRLMLIALAVTLAGSLVGGVSDALLPLVCARAMQGVGMTLLPVGIAMLRDVLPAHQVPVGVALMSATLAIGAGAGLPLAGIMVQTVDWHAIFWLTAVATALLLGAVRLIVPESPVRPRRMFDYRGALLLSVALVAGLLALSKGGNWGWTSPLTLGLAGTTLLLLLVWVPLELRFPHPLIDLRLAARPAVLLVNTAAVLVGIGMFANLLVSAQLLQLPTSTGFGLGLDIVESGLWMAPTALVFGLMAPVSAVIIRWTSARMTLVLGAAGMSAAYVARTFLSEQLWQIVLASTLVAAGTSLTYAAMPILVMRAVPLPETASANGVNVLLRSVGNSTSSAALAASITVASVQVGADLLPTFDAFRFMFLVSAGTCGLAAATAIGLYWVRAEVIHEDAQAIAVADVAGDAATAVPPAEARSAGGRWIRHP